MTIKWEQVSTDITKEDLFLFNEGTNYNLYNKMGAHLVERNGQRGVLFRVWAPSAREISIIGSFNNWQPGIHMMGAIDSSGIWEGFIPNIGEWDLYKFHIVSHNNGFICEKSDPFGFCNEVPPKSASIIKNLNYQWGDETWLHKRKEHNSLNAPISIYEIHLGSWRKKVEENRSLSYRELATELVDYVKRSGFTHVELLPIMEHPYYGSWGYQITNYFAPTARFGHPEDLMFLIDSLHQNDIGVILDWVPSHFATDGHALGFFDGTHLFEHADPRQGFHPDWGSFIFNYGRHEVRSFLISNAFYWLDKYHIDGLRVDAVASMLYLDYSRKDGEWIPNQYGGKENIEAISFLKQFNEAVYRFFPDVQTIAEESTAWTGVSRPVFDGGLGFGFKWDMGWMHDTLTYMRKDPVHRKYHQNDLTFRYLYAFTENFTLPLSHDEVVHGKGSLMDKMPGDLWQRFANLRALYGYMFTAPGKKLLFMGGEFGQWNEWNHDESLQWHLRQFESHEKIYQWVKDLNYLYRQEPALHRYDCDPKGFQWVDCTDAGSSVISFLRKGDNNDTLLVVINFTPVTRQDYHVGVPFHCAWREILNSDAECYGGSGIGNLGKVWAHQEGWNFQPHSVYLTLPPLGVLVFKPEN